MDYDSLSWVDDFLIAGEKEAVLRAKKALAQGRDEGICWV
jgi:hypothetical protein